QKIVVAKLKTIGYKVDIANNGKEAVEMFLSNRYDLVLMDHYMPEKDGLIASKEIREYENKQKDSKHTPILIITANSISEMKIDYKDAYIDDFIEKPFNIDKLAYTIQEWLFNKETKVLN
ncbi:MAG: response regulator, partial [Blastocatellia bacterium]|nr:response regulator [Blastocatellia bacterium]